jgi:hypothetical protein
MKRLPLNAFRLTGRKKSIRCLRCLAGRSAKEDAFKSPSVQASSIHEHSAAKAFDEETLLALASRGIRLIKEAWTQDDQGSFTRHSYLLDDNGTRLIRDHAGVLALVVGPIS